MMMDTLKLQKLYNRFPRYDDLKAVQEWKKELDALMKELE